MADSSSLDHLRKALENYHDLEALARSPLQSLYVLRMRLNSSVSPLDISWKGVALRAILDRALHELGTTLPDSVTLLTLRYLQQQQIKDLEGHLHLRAAALHDRINKAIAALWAAIMQMENEASRTPEARIQARFVALPTVPLENLVGWEAAAKDIQARLRQQITHPQLPLLVTGLGGIGKTTLVVKMLRSGVLDESSGIERVLWVTIQSEGVGLSDTVILDKLLKDLASQLSLSPVGIPTIAQQLERITAHLTLVGHRFLLVLDNIETETESRAALHLTQTLRAHLPIILTSRRAFDLEVAAMQLIPVHELAEPYALSLIQLESERLALPALPSHETDVIYNAVGGHPLALKLVVAQRRYLPLEPILASLGSRTDLANKLFAPIYDVAWDLLTPIAQSVLVGLTVLPPTGGFWEALVDAAAAIDPDLSSDVLIEAIRELSQLNLLQITHDVTRQPIYSLHRLTYRYVEQLIGIEVEDLL